MKPTTKRVAAILGLLGVAVVGAPAMASAGGATIYVLTENMKLVQRNPKPNPKPGTPVSRRSATGALTGVAGPGTPLCPIPEFQSGPAGCAVNMLGGDDISLTTGLGTLQAHFSTVVQGDNPVDGPEAIVLTGEFTGDMDFSPAILHQIPFGTVAGKVKPSRGRWTDFTGVFRLPFAGNFEVAPGVTLRQIFCPLSPIPNTNAALFYGGVDLAYLDFDDKNVPNGHCLDIQPTELSLGAPLVRFDISF